MKIWSLYLNQSNGEYKLEFETNDKNEMYNHVVGMLYDNRLTYDPCANYPSKSLQIKLFDKHFNQFSWDYISNLLEGYIEAKEINPNSGKKDRETYIRCKLKEHYKEAQELGYEVFGIFIQGSQNYNLDTYSEEYWSDIDTKCIVLPSLDDIILNRKPTSTTHERENKEHIDLKDIRLMWDCFKKQNVNFVEILFTDYYIISENYQHYWDEMRKLAEDITHAHQAQTVRTMSGMSMEKYKALKHPYPTIVNKIEKYGYDPKQLHHIVRINDFIQRYTSGMSFKDAMTPTPYMKKKLIDIKMGKLSLIEAEKIAKKYDDKTKEIKDQFIESHSTKDGKDIINIDIYNRIDEIKAEILKQRFKEELLKNSS